MTLLAALLGALALPCAAAQDGTATLAFAGDVLLADGPGEAIARGEDPLAAFAPLLAEADLAVGNLECPVATTGTAVAKPVVFRAHPRTLELLKKRFGAVSVANNHSGDYGKAAFLETLAGLRAQGLPFFGGGRDLSEAHAPLIVERAGLRIALLGYSEFKPRAFEAGASSPGVAWSEEGQVLADIRAARAAGADIVIPFLHWGWEEEGVPCPRQRELARRLIDAGADAVVGGHPHVTQGAEHYKGKPIVYSLGNFLFDGFQTEPTRTGWLLRMTVSRAGVLRWDTVVARLDERGAPRPDLEAQSPCGEAGARTPALCRAGRRFP